MFPPCGSVDEALTNAAGPSSSVNAMQAVTSLVRTLFTLLSSFCGQTFSVFVANEILLYEKDLCIEFVLINPAVSKGMTFVLREQIPDRNSLLFENRDNSFRFRNGRH